jgi:nitrate/TMAO reductase-like tetraheme cytochrome c subunit
MNRSWGDGARGWLRPALFLGRNPITLIGAVATTGAALTMIGFWGLELVRREPMHPYAGLVLFVGLPAVFVLGLLLMPAGILWERWRRRRRGELPESYPPFDLGAPAVKRTLLLVGAASVLNVVILGTASYHAVEHMDSVEFCGTTCHSVMEPEHTSYLESAHSRVACVQCHIGPGASWFVKSKLSGARQVYAAAFGTHSRPIPTPVTHLRPARETCEQCHWPQKLHGDKLVVRTHFAADEHNTASTTVLLLKVGGRGAHGDIGIHGRHLGDGERIRYVTTDDKRQVIASVTRLDDNGQTTEYVSPKLSAAAKPGAGEHRSMDCLDCHNRPAHTFELPEKAVDRALAEGRISVELPFVKKQAVEVLRTEYPDRETATKRIGESLTQFYERGYPQVFSAQRALVDAAVAQTRAIYLRNVFPYMKVTWGTYPNNVGHDDFPGCFRCHDGEHVAPGGQAISQDCDTCHTIVASDEAHPKILDELGLK